MPSFDHQAAMTTGRGLFLDTAGRVEVHLEHLPTIDTSSRLTTGACRLGRLHLFAHPDGQILKSLAAMTLIHGSAYL